MPLRAIIIHLNIFWKSQEIEKKGNIITRKKALYNVVLPATGNVRPGIGPSIVYCELLNLRDWIMEY